MFVLLRGALRVVSGTLGKRSPDTFSLVVPQSTIGIRGTDFMVVLVNPAYLSVLKGTVTATNAAGTVTFRERTLGSLANSTTLAVPIPESALPRAAASRLHTDLRSHPVEVAQYLVGFGFSVRVVNT